MASSRSELFLKSAKPSSPELFLKSAKHVFARICVKITGRA